MSIDMIKILDGIRETVDYDLFSGIKLYHNMQAEDYPLHWHTAMEIIMPVQDEYTVVIDETSHTFGPDDIFIIPPGTLHHLIAPPRQIWGNVLSYCLTMVWFAV